MSGHPTIVTPTPAGFQTHKVAHHYTTAEQEFQACKFAFWLFLATEVMLFGGLFMAYIGMKGEYPETFVECGKQLDWKLGGLNTLILLTSSWTMALAVRAAQHSERKPMLVYLNLTIACAFGFMVVKYFEYSSKFEHGVFPGWFYHPHGETALALSGLAHPNLFFSMYFTMTALHGLHVVGGIVAISWLVWRGSQGRFHSGYYLPVDLIGLYWHIVDIIWIFLFPLLYLVP